MQASILNVHTMFFCCWSSAATPFHGGRVNAQQTGLEGVGGPRVLGFCIQRVRLGTRLAVVSDQF